MSLHFILDGYNLIKQDAMMSSLKLEAGRAALISRIEKFQPQGSLRNSVTIVFDGQLAGDDCRHASGIRVIFTSFESADEQIKRLVDESENSKNIVVVTDDRDIRFFVRALGAQLMSAKEFLRRAQSGSLSARHVHQKTQSQKTDKNEIASQTSYKITSELTQIWLKKNKA